MKDKHSRLYYFFKYLLNPPYRSISECWWIAVKMNSIDKKIEKLVKNHEQNQTKNNRPPL